MSASALMSGDAGILVGGVPILARIYLKLGTWRWTLSASLDDDAISGILSSLAAATESARGWAKAWHKWALFNTAVMSHHTVMHNPAAAARHVVAAVNGYFRSIALGSANQKGGDGSLQVSLCVQVWTTFCGYAWVHFGPREFVPCRASTYIERLHRLVCAGITVILG